MGDQGQEHERARTVATLRPVNSSQKRCPEARQRRAGRTTIEALATGTVASGQACHRGTTHVLKAIFQALPRGKLYARSPKGAVAWIFRSEAARPKQKALRWRRMKSLMFAIAFAASKQLNETHYSSHSSWSSHR
ncbi:hypothetical protein V7S43_012676 [Phytophthora oleae]|uniref:Uncharacterized protein n=1 Tax=Phytophthora oleae TaxID=2107226 RepID=A0ABD3FA11_9STRA